MERNKRTVADSREGGRVFLLVLILAALSVSVAAMLISGSIASSAQMIAHAPSSSSAQTNAP